MKTKTLLYIIIILVVLLMIWGIAALLGSSSGNNTVDLELGRLNNKTVDQIVIVDKEKTIILKQRENSWKVGDFDADRSVIDGLWSMFDEIEITRPISRNPGNHKKFEVDSTKAVKVSFLKDSNEIVSLFIGKNETAFTTSYLRLDNENKVYVVNTDLRRSFSSDLNYWRDKIILTLREDAVARVEYDDFILTKQDDKSWLAEDRSGNTAIVQKSIIAGLFNNLNPLEARGFVSKDISVFNAVSKTIKFFDTNNTVLGSLTLFEQESAWWVQRDSDATIYDVPSYRISNILLDRSKLFDEEGK